MINVLLREAVDGMLRLVAATDVAVITADDNVTKEFVSIAVSDEMGYLVCRDPRLLSEYDSLLIDGFRLGRLDFSKYMFECEEEEEDDDDDDSGIFS